MGVKGWPLTSQDRRSYRHEPAHLPCNSGYIQSHACPKGIARQEDLVRVNARLSSQPCQSALDIFLFADPLVIASLTVSYPAEVEAQYAKTLSGKCTVKGSDNIILHVPIAQRMRMAENQAACSLLRFRVSKDTLQDKTISRKGDMLGHRKLSLMNRIQNTAGTDVLGISPVGNARLRTPI
jgi:hypothetical protein